MNPAYVYLSVLCFACGLFIGWGLGTWAEHRFWLDAMDKRFRP